MKIKRNGSVFVNHGLWYYAVKLPGEKARRQIPLKAPGSGHTLSADRPREMAIAAAARYWEDATRQRRASASEGPSVEDVCAAWADHARAYYRDAAGNETSEVAQVIIGVRLFREMYSRAAIAELRHGDMLKFRDALERSGVARVTVNRRLGIVRRMLAWALDEGLITATQKAELSQVRTLRRGRSAAHETEPVRPVDDERLQKVLEVLSPNTADLVRVQRLTGMRPEEVCALSWSRIDRTRTPWVYRPERHKNAWRGAPRVVLIGPRAREVLERHRGAADVPFSPAVAMAERFAALTAARDGKPPRKKPVAERHPRVFAAAWNTGSFTGTIKAACQRAGVAPWSSNQLRHAFATDVRRAFGLDAARAVLGHSAGAGCVTDRYSFDALEDETIRVASPAVEALG